MANNKVVLGNEVLIDLTDSTVNPNVLLAGYKAYDASGNAITGEFSPSYHITLTQAQYDQVSQQEKMADENFFYITDAVVVGADIDDTTTSATKVWSSNKVNTELSAKANSADVPTKAQITNPNLLDNPWFTINQRGQSSYDYGVNGYTVDRWKINGGSLVLNNNGVTFITNVQYTALEQFLPSDIFEAGKEYTISYKKIDGTYFAKTFTYANSESWVNIWDNDISGWYASYRTINGVVQIGVLISRGSSETSVSFKAVKLELGSISTLALDTAPNYATELLKCQRYFYRIPITIYNYGGMGISHTGSFTIVTFYTPVNMRVKPSVLTGGNLTLRNGNSIIPITGNSLYGADDSNRFDISFAAASNALTVGTAYQLYASNQATYVDFIADL